jgi:hypothetical protein
MTEHEHQCPYCELRFSYLAEVKDHVARDHPSHREVVEGLDPHELPRTGVGRLGPIDLTGHQCPWCELRFAFTNELRSHMDLDHAEHHVVNG